MNHKLDNDIEEIVDIGNRRLAIVTIIWCLITVPIIFFIPQNDLVIFAFFWLIWALIGIRLSPTIVRKIWKDYE